MAVALGNAFFGSGGGDVLLDGVLCNGSESRLLDCTTSLTHDCTHNEDVGVRCGGKCFQIFCSSCS